MKRVLIFVLLICFSFGVLADGKLIGVKESDFEKPVKVVVKMKDSSLVRSFSSESRNDVSYKVLEVGSKELDSLLDDPNVLGVYPEFHIHAFLSEAVGIINSTASNGLIVNSLNLTGGAQIVCVIDSGVNFSHPDLTGKNASCVVDCYNKACVENCSVGDDNGHGTHVAGIVGASGGVVGVAPNVSLIGVKILSSTGDGSGNGDDLPNAVNYCVSAGADVISMSLGTSVAFETSCDGVGGLGSWRTAVDNAVAAGVAVVVSSGNEANYTAIAAPACFSNSIPVGDTYDANVGGLVWGGGTCTDATTALDQIVCHANRNSLVELFAPGALINSTWNNGSYKIEGGTSMAAPMVSGAIAILKQYFNLSSQSFTPSEIEDILNDSGKVIYDSAESGLNFSRIDVHAALMSVDVTVPNVTLVSPVDNHVNLSVNQSFSCNVSDWQLSNLTLRVWNSSGLYYNGSVDVSGVSNSSSFDVENMASGSYSWNCEGVDLKSNSDYASANFSLTIGGIEVTQNSPSNNSYTNVNYSDFNCSASTEGSYDLSNLTFAIWNSSHVLIYNETRDVSGISNSSLFNYTFLEDDYFFWDCVAVNNNSDEAVSSNYTINYDSVSPNVSGVSVSTSSSSATISWTTDEVANSSVAIGGGTWSNSSSYVTSHSVSVASLSSSTGYDYVLFSCDRASNCVNESGSFTTDAVVVVSSGGGGGGGGGSTTTSIDTSQLSDGYSKVLSKGDKIKFDFYDGEEHLLSLNSVSDGLVSLTIQSDPINFNLREGETKKFSLASKDYYDLLVRTDEVSRSSAKVYVEMISEMIESGVVADDKMGQPIEQEEVVVGEGEDESSVFGWIVVGVVLILVVRLLISGKEKEIKKRVTKKKHGKGKKTKAKAKRSR